ncbi:TPA: hypothetical protein JHJ64_004568 [Enterobacter cloacae]|uniref:hypothetical protein n=1 Tax=Enterobacter hormaechei TaxID=158836 RepID=UPI001909F55D|nr:hypothetical protein [Enterobacter hormaechei]MBK4366970.1 hypothetical protein [Enterobacter hormaechei]MBK4597775.1 hypothetical protein [Enterobacter hormaechei]WLZ47512.1 hypothetical protein QPR64_23595 [Enterobacter hormaechei]HAV2128657.1 hypothetical protein [Enterobacter cloacae]
MTLLNSLKLDSSHGIQFSMGGKKRRANWSPIPSGSTTPFFGSEHFVAGNLPADIEGAATTFSQVDLLPL